MNSINKNLRKLQKYTGLAGVAVIWLGIAFGMNQAGLRLIDPRPISYLGINPRTSLLFTTSLLTSAILFTCFGFYLRNTLRISNLFIYFLVFGQIGQAIAAIIPYGGNYKFTHTLAAYALAFSLPFVIQQFYASQRRAPRAKVYGNLLRLEVCAFVLGIAVFSFTKGIAPIGEALPAIGFHVWIIVVTFTITNPSKDLYKHP